MIHITGNSHAGGFGPFYLANRNTVTLNLVGATTAHALHTKPEYQQVLSMVRPDDHLVIVGMGEIDCRSHIATRPASDRQVAIQETISNFTRAIVMARQRTPHVYVLGIHPPTRIVHPALPPRDHHARTVLAWNDFVEDMCDTLDVLYIAPPTFLYGLDGFLADTFDTRDFSHLKHDGYTNGYLPALIAAGLPATVSALWGVFMS